MFDIENELKAFGPFKRCEHYFQQCNLPNFAPDIYLNVIFDAIDSHYYQKVEEVLKIKLRDDLWCFYKKYNGMNLFSQTFVIFGLRVPHEKDNLKPVEFIYGNASASYELKKCGYSNWVAFGFCGKQHFLIDRQNPNSAIVAYDIFNNKLCHQFNTLDELFEYYIPKLAQYYGSDGYIADKKNELINNILSISL